MGDGQPVAQCSVGCGHGAVLGQLPYAAQAHDIQAACHPIQPEESTTFIRMSGLLRTCPLLETTASDFMAHASHADW